MCGIAGHAAFGGRKLPEETEQTLSRMLRTLSLRGPDDNAMIVDHSVAMGFSRLAIVDLPSGRQPFVSEDGSVVLTVNGEIYNHRELAKGLPQDTTWRSKSDCEVLLHLYHHRGLEFLEGVRGMFALTLWDRRRARLLLARDYFGIKPLFYHRDRERLVYGSEIKALLQDPRCPRTIAWEDALADRALTWEPLLVTRRPQTWFTGVDAVRPGTILDFNLKTADLTEHAFWRFPPPSGHGETGASDAEIVRHYGDILRSSVTDCLMADVEIGLMLSGGVDSASLAALATSTAGDAGPAMHTFTVLNGTTTVNGDAEHAHHHASRLGLPNHQVLFERDRIPSGQEWKNLLWLQETPLCGPEQFYKYELYRYVRSVRPGLKVMLLGQGSDEFNGGYSADMAGDDGWEGFIAELTGMSRRTALASAPELSLWWETTDKPLLRDTALPAFSPPVDSYAAFITMKYHDIERYNCWHEDRSASGHGIEARVPFLDPRLVELTAAIPPQRRARLLWDKRILRDAMRDVLPDPIRKRPKVPFILGHGGGHSRAVFAQMLTSSNGELLDEALATPAAAHLLHADGLRAALKQLRDVPSSHMVDRVLRLINLGLLATMAADPPDLIIANGPRAPRAYSVTEWSAQRTDIESVTLGRHSPDDTVLAFAENVLLLRDDKDSDISYLAIDGTVEYMIREQDAPAWSRLLREIDGRTTLSGVMSAADAEHADILDLLSQALEEGILVTTP
ncbi:asparagine synthase (glutamine-hydrolyzing) [Streptomyces sp. NBC_00289]